MNRAQKIFLRDLFSWMFLYGVLFCSPLMATVNEPMRWEWLSGYRNDFLHWHLQNGETDSVQDAQIAKNMQLWENDFAVRTIYKDLTFYCIGGFGAFGRGGLVQKEGEDSFHARIHGITSDGTLALGYAVNLTADRVYKTLFIPLGGYSVHFEKLYAPSSTIKTSYQINHTTSLWYGFFAGADFMVAPGGRCNFYGGYHYHWVHLHFTSKWTNQSVVEEECTKVAYCVKAAEGGNLGQTGWGKIEYMISSFWRCAVGAQLHYFSTHLLNARVQRKKSGAISFSESLPSHILSAQKLKVRWTPVLGWVEISRNF